MAKFTKELIDDLANKLLIGLTDEENEMILKEFNIIDANMELITKISKIKEVEPMTHTIPSLSYTLREDEKEESIDIKELLQNCDDYEGREISVPKVVGGD